MKLKLFLLIIVTLYLVGTASATDYYVDANTGNDGDDGESLVNAWLTLEFAAGELLAGDTLYLVDGTWTDEYFISSVDGTAEDIILVTAYNGTPTLYATSPVANVDKGFTITHNYWNISNIIINHYWSAIKFSGDNCHAINITINSQNPGISTEGIQLGGNNSSVCDSIFTGTFWNGVQLVSRKYDGGWIGAERQGYIIRNCVFKDNSLHGSIDFMGNVTDVHIIGNTFENNSVGTIYAHQGIPEYIYIQDNIWLEDNADGIKLDAGANHVLIDNNTISFNLSSGSAHHIRINDAPAWLPSFYGTNITVSNNYGRGNVDNYMYEISAEYVTFSSNDLYSEYGDTEYLFYEHDHQIVQNHVGNTYNVIRSAGINNTTVEYTDGRVFSENKDGSPLYYPTHSNFSILDGAATEITRHNMTITPVCGYGKDVVINIDSVDDVSNITANVSEAATVTMTFAVDNESNTYNFYVDDVWNASAVSNSNAVVSFDHDFLSSTLTNFEVTWNSTVGWSYNEGSIYLGKRFSVDDNGNFTQQETPTQDDTNLTGLINVVVG